MRKLPNLPLTEVQRQLCVDNRRMVKWAVNRWIRCFGEEFDDACLTVQMGLIRAAQLWNPDYVNKEGMHVAFSTYAVHWLRRKCFEWIEVRDKDRQIAMLSDFDGDEDRLTLEDRTADRSNMVAVMDMLAYCRRFVSAKQWRVLEMRFLEGRTLVDVGKELGVTRERVRQIEAQGKRQIRKAMAE